MKFEFSLPMKAETLNVRLRKHPMAQHREKKAEIAAVAQQLPRHQLRPLVTVTLTRCGPKPLDHEDNLTGSLKAYRDAVARVMRLDDASPLVAWKYEQEPAREFSVRVRVEAVGELPPDTRPPPKPWQLPPQGPPRPPPPPRGSKLRTALSSPARPKSFAALAKPAVYRPGDDQ